jgi:hypothetical protein
MGAGTQTPYATPVLLRPNSSQTTNSNGVFERYIFILLLKIRLMEEVERTLFGWFCVVGTRTFQIKTNPEDSSRFNRSPSDSIVVS